MSEPKQGRRPRKRIAPSEKYEVFVQVVTQQATQREAVESVLLRSNTPASKINSLVQHRRQRQ